MIPRNPALDALRGIAVLAVIATHTTQISARNPLADTVMAVPHIGWAGVDLFFVLSGFLITGVLLRAKGSPDYFRHFYARRVRRILPPYLILLAFFWFAAPALSEPFPGLARGYHHDRWLLATFTANIQPFVDPTWPPPAGHLWSLSVEEQFYLVWPFVVLATPRRRLASVCVAIFVGAFALRCALNAFGVDPQAIYSITLCRADALAAGGWVAARGAVDVRGAKRAALGAFAVLYVVNLLYGQRYITLGMQTVGFSAFAVLGAAMVGVAARTDTAWSAWLARRRWLHHIGRYSYTMYLWHLPIVCAMTFVQLDALGLGRMMGSPVLGQLAAYAIVVVASAAIAAASWHYLESPILTSRYRTRGRSRT